MSHVEESAVSPLPSLQPRRFKRQFICEMRRAVMHHSPQPQEKKLSLQTGVRTIEEAHAHLYVILPVSGSICRLRKQVTAEGLVVSQILCRTLPPIDHKAIGALTVQLPTAFIWFFQHELARRAANAVGHCGPGGVRRHHQGLLPRGAGLRRRLLHHRQGVLRRCRQMEE